MCSKIQKKFVVKVEKGGHQEKAKHINSRPYKREKYKTNYLKEYVSNRCL